MIDTHLHLWRLGAGWYGWNTPDLGPVHVDSELSEVSEAMTRVGVTTAILVQAADRLAETDWLLDLAAEQPSVGGVVGYLPLDDVAALEDLLARHAGSGLVGVRQLWHDHDDPDELAAETTIRCLRLLGEGGLPVDVPNAFPSLWPALVRAVQAAPDTTFVLDHCGKPPFGDPAAWSRWERSFSELAGRPNVVVKLSGLFAGSGLAPARETELARVVELTRTAAGPGRTMIGSDWPMSRGTLDYAGSMIRLDGLLSEWSPAEQEQAKVDTALRTYRPTGGTSVVGSIG
ncbi:MAG TPA: amidohydrolase family protein [Microlunatus sp.]|nr:amidohydrolase family protein [Microlunatus sp.]